MKELNTRWNVLARVIGAKKETVRKAYKRLKDSACIPAKDKSTFSGRLAVILKRIVMETPSHSNEDLSHALKAHCREGEKPPRDTVQI